MVTKNYAMTEKNWIFCQFKIFFNLDGFMVSHFNNSNASVGKVKESVKN